MKRQIILRGDDGKPVIQIDPPPEHLRTGVMVSDNRPFLYVYDPEKLPLTPFGLRALYKLVMPSMRARVRPCPVAIAMTVRGGSWGMCSRVYIVSDRVDPEKFLKHFGGHYSLLDSGIVPVEKLTFLKAEHRFQGLDDMVYVGPGIT